VSRACSYDEQVATNVSAPGDASAADGSGGSTVDPSATEDSRVSPTRTRGVARLTGPVWRPSLRSLRGLALASVVANAGIIITGAAVRLSQSGLGCPDWPACTTRSLVATHTAGQTIVNTWIEFGNRLLTFVVMAIAVAVFVAALRLPPAYRDGRRARRSDLVWLAAAQPASIVLQAVLGGITVLTSLNPAMVSVHFLVSMAILAVTVVLYVRCGEDTGPARPLVRADLRVLSGAVLATAGLMFAAGTVVAGTGPLAGNAAAPRYHLPLEGVTQLHADIGWLFGGLALALAIGLKLTGAPPRAIRLGWVLLAVMTVQGALGYTQYFTGLPPVLVGLHVLGSVLVWITALLLFFALRDRGSIAANQSDQVTETPQPAAG
jgi:cytochrome c oxidase assembly protein subunit 15